MLLKLKMEQLLQLELYKNRLDNVGQLDLGFGVYLDDAQRVVQVFAGLLFLRLLLLLPLGLVLVAVVVNAEAEEHLHGAKAVVEVAETHLIET